MRYRFETAWGSCALDWTGGGLAGVHLPGLGAVRARDEDGARPPAAVARWAEMMRAYFDGAPIDFREIPLDPSGVTETDSLIYAALRETGYGRSTTYGELAAAAGLGGMARAVGGAMARNRCPIVTPCHRVLAKGWALGGFSAPGGLDTKRRLLALENIPLGANAPSLPGLFDGL